MSKPRHIYVIGNQTGYACWMQGRLTDNMHNADLVVLTGGEDVNPSLYGHRAHPFTSFNENRDTEEVKEYNKALGLKKPIVGICRGAQFLCVMAGGKLIQHQSNEKLYHYMNTYDERSLRITSMHHQAQYPWDLGEDDYRVLGWTLGLSPYHEGEDRKEMVNGKIKDCLEVEDCHYPHIRGLAIQGHPEMYHQQNGVTADGYNTIEYYRALLDRFIIDFPNAK